MDFRKLPDPAFSQRGVDVLASKDIYGIQLVSAKVLTPKDPFDEPRDFWFVHVWNSDSTFS